MSGVSDIDWDLIWRKSRMKRSCKNKGRKDWDKKAPSFARRNMRSSYIKRLLDFIAPEPEDTVLDVGAGPGTLAIPLASRARLVTAIDYSAGMLEELKAEADRQSLTNIVPVHASWEDDWQKIGVAQHHDIAVASRSLSVDDLQGALAKLDKWAFKRVVVTDRVGAGPFDPEIFAAIGRDFDPGPDYIITVNMLYSMGINAKVDYIPAEYSDSYPTREEAIDSCLWMLEDMNPGERERFEAYMDERLTRQDDGTWRLTRRHKPKWAVISWEK
ncbi:MAG: class I SAM-dependent methyltransferase [Thermodesulfobacteriota bacterium]